MGRRAPPHFLQTQNGDDFRGIFCGNIATEFGHGINSLLRTLFYLKKSLNASSRPSEHPPIRGKIVKRLGGIIDRLQIQNLGMAFKRVPRW